MLKRYRFKKEPKKTLSFYLTNTDATQNRFYYSGGLNEEEAKELMDHLSVCSQIDYFKVNESMVLPLKLHRYLFRNPFGTRLKSMYLREIRDDAALHLLGRALQYNTTLVYFRLTDFLAESQDKSSSSLCHYVSCIPEVDFVHNYISSEYGFSLMRSISRTKGQDSCSLQKLSINFAYSKTQRYILKEIVSAALYHGLSSLNIRGHFGTQSQEKLYISAICKAGDMRIEATW